MIRIRIAMGSEPGWKPKLGLSSSSGGELQSAKGQSCCKGQFVDLIRHLVQHFQVHLFNKVFTDFTQLCLFNSLTCALSRILTDLDQTWFGINNFSRGWPPGSTWENFANFSKWFSVRSVTFGLSMGGSEDAHMMETNANVAVNQNWQIVEQWSKLKWSNETNCGAMKQSECRRCRLDWAITDVVNGFQPGSH